MNALVEAAKAEQKRLQRELDAVTKLLASLEPTQASAKGGKVSPSDRARKAWATKKRKAAAAAKAKAKQAGASLAEAAA